MRTDITTDRKQVRLPNVHLSGGNKWKAQFGDIVFYRETPEMYFVGRVAGRIAHGFDLVSGKSLKDWLIVIALGSHLNFPMERWVNPADIVNCFAPESLELADRLAYFFGPEFKKHSTHALRQWASNGARKIGD